MPDDQQLSEREQALLEAVEDEFAAHGSDTHRRRWVQAIASLGLLGAGARELYRRRILRSLPSLRLERESETDEEHWAVGWEPDPEAVSLQTDRAGGYSALLALASVGGRRRAEEHPLLSLATAGLSMFQAANAARTIIDELAGGDVDALSGIDAVLSASTVPLVLPEAVRAVRYLVESKRGSDEE